MTRRRPLLTLAAGILAAMQAQAAPVGWLTGEPAPAAEPTAAPARDALGLYAAPAEAEVYHHPFGEHAAELVARYRSETLEPHTEYFLLTEPSPASPTQSHREVRLRATQARSLGLAFLASPTRGGVPHVPLMGIARQASGVAQESPDWLQAAPVTAAQVRLCLLGLPKAGEQPYEVALAVSDWLEPGVALRRAAAVRAHTAQAWPQQGEALIKALREQRPEHLAALLEHAPEDGVILALRVMWQVHEGKEAIPGPGGLLVRAVDIDAAHARLQALYRQATP